MGHNYIDHNLQPVDEIAEEIQFASITSRRSYASEYSGGGSRIESTARARIYF